MPMIVANKRRIASVFVDYHFDAGVVVELKESRETAELFRQRSEYSHFEIQCAKICKESLSDCLG
jgi:hypothetical protein